MKQRIIILSSASALAVLFSLMSILSLSVMAAGGSITQTTTADFSQSCTVLTNSIPVPILANTHVSDMYSGTVTLAATFIDDFNGSALDSRWETGLWTDPPGSYTPNVASSVLTLGANEHGWVRSSGTYTHGVIEAVAEFGQGTSQHIGFASSGFGGSRYFIFSTAGTIDTLFARVNNNSSEQFVSLGSIPTGFHRYTVGWKPLDADTDRISFFIDGISQHEFDVVSDAGTGEARDFYAYLSNDGAGNLRIGQVQVEPSYESGGSYTSCAFDANNGNGWQTISWDAAVTSSTSLAVEARVSGDGSTWSAWQSVTSGGWLNNSTMGRYAQYRLLLSTNDTQLSPEVGWVTLDYDALPNLSIDNVSVTEGNAGTVNAVFPVTLSASSPHTITVNYATANSTAVAPGDYVATTGLLTFAPGDTTQMITVTVQGDLIDEADETFFVNLNNSTNARISDGQGKGTGTITDDDLAPTVSINNVAVTEGNSGTINAVFTVSLSQASGKIINVDYATANSSATASSDYLAASGTLTFATGVTAQQITVTINGDSIVEPNETFLVNLSNLINLNSSGNDTQGTGTINNDDTANVTITQSGGSTNVVEGGTTDTYQIQLTSQPVATVTINLSPGSQVTVNPTSVVFTSANWNTAQTITVTAINDVVAEGAHTGVISHSASSTDNAYNGILINSVTANITDNDTANVSVAPTTLAVAEGGITATYTISLTSQPTATVTVNMTPNGQVSAAPLSLEFNSSNWNIAQSVVVTAINDTLSENPANSGVISHTVASADPKYNNLVVPDVTAYITDNDAAAYKVFLPLVIK